MWLRLLQRSRMKSDSLPPILEQIWKLKQLRKPKVEVKKLLGWEVLLCYIAQQRGKEEREVELLEEWCYRRHTY